jgi:hypothetical protein
MPKVLDINHETKTLTLTREEPNEFVIWGNGSAPTVTFEEAMEECMQDIAKHGLKPVYFKTRDEID